MPQYQYDINLREYWRILKKRKFTVLITAIALGLFSTIFAGIKAPAPLYTSTCSIKFEKVVSVEGIFSKSFSWSEETDVETMISVIKAYHVLEKTVKRMGTVPEGSPAENVAAIVSRLESKIEASREDYTNIINIGVTDPDPVFAQRFAKTLAETFKEMHAEEQNRRTEDALKYISRKLKEVQKNLREAEDTFNRFKQDNQLVSYDLQSESLLSSTKEINDQIRKIEEAKAEFNELLVKLERFIINPSGSDHSFYSTHTNKQYANINTTLVDLLLKRDSLLGDFTPKHPRIIEIERKIIENARKMSLTLHLEIKNVDKKKAGLEKLLAEVNFNTSALMDKKLEFDRLNREVDSYNKMAALLERKNQEALIAKAETPEEVTIVRPALLPIHPNNPPKTTATGLMGLIIGFILGMVLAFITETFDTSLAAIEDVEETIGSQVLGIIPHWDLKGSRENLENKEQKEAGISSPFAQKIHLAAHFIRNSMLAETFRSLLTNIKFRDLEKKAKTIAVTSASPQEGKTMVCTNLAIIMAQAGMKTLLIGSDLRKPRLSKIFGVDPVPGLADVLLGNYHWRDAVKTISDIMVGKMEIDDVMVTPGLDNLHFITCGTIPPNPGELLNSERLTDFIEETKNEYDIVIFDVPPILSTADSIILGTKVDAVLLVYRVGNISRRVLKRATIQLSQVKINVMGVVLNGMKAELSPDFHDFKRYQYYYSQDDTKDKKDKKI